jgi:hypothetical protein
MTEWAGNPNQPRTPSDSVILQLKNGIATPACRHARWSYSRSA